ncbi:MAG: ribonuclease HII [Myxococcaceae bacterium]
MASLKRELERSVPELRERYLEREMSVPVGLLEALEADARNGARELARRIRERRTKNRAEGQRLRNLLKFEQELWASGHEFVAGCDEAGMAPLAGPVIAAAVILPRNYKLRGLDDSKKIVDEERREELRRMIEQDALAWGVGRAEVEEIDTLNIYHAGLLAMSRAVAALSKQKVPTFVLVDARKIPNCEVPQRGIIHGDALSATIAAASIIAKTTRDRLMNEIEKEYPGYDFCENKGYPTPFHCKKLKELGATPWHRRSFNRVREVLGLDPVQLDAFPEAADEGDELR